MLRLKWAVLLVTDVLKAGVVNRSIVFSLTVLFFLLIGLVMTGVQVVAPFIYTLF